MGQNGGRAVCVLGLLGLVLLAGVAVPTQGQSGGLSQVVKKNLDSITQIVEQADARLAQILQGVSDPDTVVADALRDLRSAAAGLVNLASAILGDGFTCGDGTIPPPGAVDAAADGDPNPSLERRLKAVANILIRAAERLNAIRDGISSPPDPTVTPSLQALRATAVSLVDRATSALNDGFSCGGPTGG